MNARQREIRRAQLDMQLGRLSTELPLAMPRGGWLKAIREALGMTVESFGKRMGVVKGVASHLESAEVQGTATVQRLRRAADALDCDLVISFIPRSPLGEFVEQNAERAAKRIVASVTHSMDMEAQSVSDEFDQELVAQTKRDLIERADSRIWE